MLALSIVVAHWNGHALSLSGKGLLVLVLLALLAGGASR